MTLSDKITRRQALQRIYRAIAAAGAASLLSFEDLVAAEARPDKRLNLIWLQASSCSGCSISVLDIEQVPMLDILTKIANVVLHPHLSLATGHQVPEIIQRLIQSGLGYILVVEGSIPVKMPHACMMGDKPIAHWVERLSAKADACIAVGTCAVFGGITRMNGMETGAMTLTEFLHHKQISKPVVNLPNCPMKPEHFLYTLLHRSAKGSFPELDDQGRPTRFFARTVHDHCIYYADFQEKRYARAIGDSGCLLKLGCQGPVTRNDCLISGHNNNTNTCIRAGHPCIGCASEIFPRQIMLHAADDHRPIWRDFKR